MASIINFVFFVKCANREGSGSVVECSRPKGRGLEPYRRQCNVYLSKKINPSIVLVQPRKTRTFITERLLMGCKESNQTKNVQMFR